ncbi:MAG: DNRLRE domain-containing protein, partial [Planctomycetales bacterium]|nr:DNRLRE domain-containing protein [Planctomycetales bacterium]
AVSADAVRLEFLGAAPTTSGLSDVRVQANAHDRKINLAPSFDDTDFPYDLLTYSVESNDNANLVLTTVDGDWLTLSSKADVSGTANLNIRATDQYGNSVDTPLRIVVEPSATVVDNDDPGFSTIGTGWNLQSNPSAVNGSQLGHDGGTGANTASWNATDLVAGVYDVYVTWTPNASASSDAPFAVLDDTTPLAAISVDQTVEPDIDVDGRKWKSLGTYATHSGSLVVELSDNSATGDLLADAVRLVPRVLDKEHVAVYQDAPDSTINLVDQFAGAPQLDGSLTFSIVDAPQDGLVASLVVGDELTLAYGAGVSGNTYVRVRATDSAGDWLEKSFLVSILVPMKVELAPTADATVRPGVDANNNYGGWDELHSRYTGNLGQSDDFYVKFDVAGISGNITSAFVEMYPYAAGSGTQQQAYLVDDDSWSEFGISFAQRPAGESLLEQFSVTANNWVSLDVTTQIQSLLASGTDHELSLRIGTVASTGTRYAYYHSNEYAGVEYRPRLVVTGDFDSVAAIAAQSDGYAAAVDDVLDMPAGAGLLANDSDHNGTHLFVASVLESPVHGVLTIGQDGAFQYVPDADYEGTDSFVYVATDGNQLSAPAAVSISVGGENGQATANLFPIADTYVKSASNASTNYGDSTLLSTRFKDNFEDQREIYLQFDLAEISADVTEAKLRLYTLGATSGANWHMVEQVPAGSWTENELTWENRPNAIRTIANAEVNGVGWTEVDLTELVRETLADPAISEVNLRLVTTASSTDRYANFTSREYSDPLFRPHLQLTGQIVDQPPALAGPTNANADEGTTYTLNLTSSDADAGEVHTWQIDWGDGVAETVYGKDVSPTHDYTDNGVYTVTTTAADEFGVYVGPSVSVAVANVVPTWTISGPSSVDQNSLVDLSFVASDMAGDTITASTVHWGNGQTSPIVSNWDNFNADHIYAQPGTYSIYVESTDEDGTYDSATFTLLVNATSDPAIASDDAYATSEDTTDLSGNVISDDTGAGFDADPQSDPLAIIAVNGATAAVGQSAVLPSGATLTLQANGSFVYNASTSTTFAALAAGEQATDTFVYIVDDGNGTGDVDSATVTITVDGVNDAPSAEGDSYATALDSAVSGNLISDGAADSDVDATDTLSVSEITIDGQSAAAGTLHTLASGATLMVNADGLFTYDPSTLTNPPGFAETVAENFAYTIQDGQGGTSSAQVTIEVLGPTRMLIDNADADFAATGGGWTLKNSTSTIGGTYYEATNASYGSRKATWTFAGLPAGVYRVAARWYASTWNSKGSPYAMFDGTADTSNLLGTVHVNQELWPQNDLSESGENFQYLGLPIEIVGDTLTVQLSNAAEQVVTADAVVIEWIGEPTTPSGGGENYIALIDDGDAGFVRTGSGWTAAGDTNSYGEDYVIVTAGSGSSTASWTFENVPHGEYQISTRWWANAWNADNTPYEIYNNGDLVGTVYVDQDLNPTNDVYVETNPGGYWLQNLGVPISVEPDASGVTGTLEVRIRNAVNQNMVGDVVRIERIGDSPSQQLAWTIDNGDAGFAATGSGWMGTSDPNAYGDDYHVVGSGSGSSALTYTFDDLPAGLYQVAGSWYVDGWNATNTPYAIYDGPVDAANRLDTVYVSQEVSPLAEIVENGTNLQKLGVPLHVKSGTLNVQITNAANQNVVGDAVRLELLNRAPELFVGGAGSVLEGHTYTLNLASIDPDAGTIHTWTIDWGDGEGTTVAYNAVADEWTITPSAGAAQTAATMPSSLTHVYADGFAQHNVQVAATDEYGVYFAPQHTVAVLNLLPQRSISGEGSASQNVTYALNLSAVDAGDDTVSGWTIDWGDGSAPMTFEGAPASITHCFQATPGFYSVSATVHDDDGDWSVQPIVVQVLPGSTEVDAKDDAIAVFEGFIRTGNLVTSDNAYGFDIGATTVSHVEGDAALVGTPHILPSGAQVQINADGTFVYTPSADESLSLDETSIETVSYTITSGAGESESAIASFILYGRNAVPSAVGNAYSTGHASLLVRNVLDDDTGFGIDVDADTNDSLNVIAISSVPLVPGAPIVLSSGATLTMQPNGFFSYDPSTSEELSSLSLGTDAIDSFVYTVSDGNGGMSAATVVITIMGPRVQVMDDGHAGFSTSGSWTTTGGQGGYADDYTYATNSSTKTA